MFHRFTLAAITVLLCTGMTLQAAELGTASASPKTPPLDSPPKCTTARLRVADGLSDTQAIRAAGIAPAVQPATAPVGRAPKSTVSVRKRPATASLVSLRAS